MSATFATIFKQNLDLTDWHVVAGLIDHTLLRPDATRAEVTALCEQAIQYGFKTVFVHPAYLAHAAALVRGSQVQLGAPVGFPFGANLTSAKRAEAEAAIRLGANELDMVINIGALKSRERETASNDLRGVIEVAHSGGVLLKVIIETSLLSVEEKILACQLSLEAGADFVKTCTGFNGGGATVDDIALMRGVVGGRAGVKASGGVRTAAQLTALVEAGASRIGTSAGAGIVRELGAI
jgi:deoxyribose-phosphate aldolase